MHSRLQSRHTERIWQISLEQIEATVSEFLGPGRVKGNSREPAFSRHVSMYLARHVGGWNFQKISRFYNSRHDTTVLFAIRNIDRLRRESESIDDLLDMLTHLLNPETILRQTESSQWKWRRPDGIEDQRCTVRPDPLKRTRRS